MAKKTVKYFEETVEDSPIKDYETILLGGAQLKLGDWVKFEQVGKIISITHSASKPNDVSVIVSIKSDTYCSNRILPKRHQQFSCAKCGKKHLLAWKASDCYDSHKKKAK